MAEGNTAPLLEDELAEQAFREVFPNGLPRRRNLTVGSALGATYPLGPEHLVALAEEPKEALTERAPLARLQYSHHKLAMLLASGMSQQQASVVSGYSPSTISILASDPLFRELQAYYHCQVTEAFADTLDTMKNLHADVLAEIGHRLSTDPAAITMPALIEMSKVFADRTGKGPSSTNTLNLNVGVVDSAEIARIKATAAARVVQGQVGPAPSEGDGPQVGAIEGQARVIERREETGSEGSRPQIRGEGDLPSDSPVSAGGPPVPSMD